VKNSWESIGSNRIHVLHVVDSLRVGGLESGVVNMINALDSGKFRNSICCLKETGDLQKRLRDPEVQVFQLHQRPGSHLFPRLRRLVRQEQIDIIHSNNWGTFFDSVVAGRLARRPLIIHCIHGLFTEDLERMKFRRRFIQRMLSRGTHRLYAVADYLRNFYIRTVGVPPGRIGTIYNGVDTEVYRVRGEDQRRAEKQRLGFSPEEVLIGSVGTLYWIKDPETLLAAAASILRTRQDVNFVWVGDGRLREKLLARAEQLGLGRRVRYLGTRDNVADILSAMDIFVLPSVIEGLSYSILEAMASGVPVVATRVGGNGELIREGIDGHLVPPGDRSALIDALMHLISDEKARRAMGSKVRQRAVQIFSLQEMVTRYQTMYLEGIAKTGRAGADPSVG